MKNNNAIYNDTAILSELAETCEIGHLAIITPGGVPRSIALNFALRGNTIIFHGALTGEKFDAMVAGGPVGFTIARPYSVIPSHWITPRFAGTATHYFKSVEICGECHIVTDQQEKIAGLVALMEKYQPEGKYDVIDSDDPKYATALENVGVFRLNIESWTSKRKFGQGKPKKIQATIIDQLRMRAKVMDEETANEIGKNR